MTTCDDCGAPPTHQAFNLMLCDACAEQYRKDRGPALMADELTRVAPVAPDWRQIALDLLAGLPRCNFRPSCDQPATRGKGRGGRYCDRHWQEVAALAPYVGPVPPDLPQAAAVRAALAVRR